MTHKIIIDTDPGIDDAMAILFAFGAAEIEVLGLTTVFGNVSAERATLNALTLSQWAGKPVPVAKGAETPLMMEPRQHADYVHGQDGFGNIGWPEATCERDIRSAPHFIVDTVNAHPGEVTLVALGPLTNLAVLALARPDLLPRIARITWMGGGITRGNHTASAEFNALADPEAVAVLLSRAVPLTMVDLDACRKVEIVEADVQALASAPLLRDLLGGYLDIALSRGRPAMALYDPVAAAALILVSAGFLIYQRYGSEAVVKPKIVEKNPNIEAQKGISLGDLSPNLKKVETYYMANINLELSKLEISEENESLINSFMEQLDALNTEYENLNTELNEIGPNDQTISALIQNLQLRLQLLQKLKKKLNELKTSKNGQVETNIM